MTFRDKLAISIPPLLLRLFLAATFLWAGYGKLFSTTTVEPTQAAILANMGVNITPPEIDPDPAPAPPSHPDTLDEPLPEATPPRDAVDEVLQDDDADQRSSDRDEDPDAEAERATENGNQSEADHSAASGAAPVFMMLVSDTEADDEAAPARFYTSDDFDGPVVVRRVYTVALALHDAANPGPDGPRPLVPDWMAADSRPAQIAWMVGVVELLGGALVLLGLFTRLSALALACVIGMALWITSIGPVAFGPPGTESFLGFLPHLDGFSPQAWMIWLWQLALTLSALALALSRPGLLALDGLLFGASRGNRVKKQGSAS